MLREFGSGRLEGCGNVRDWLYVADHCAAVEQVVRHGRTYNIDGRSERTNLVVVHLLCDVVDELQPRADGSSRRDLVTFVTDRPGHDRRYAIDSRRIEQELGWRPGHSYETGPAPDRGLVPRAPRLVRGGHPRPL